MSPRAEAALQELRWQTRGRTQRRVSKDGTPGACVTINFVPSETTAH